jgi:UDP-glucose 4-epimerase
MNILITGGCGFIGSNFAKYHLDQGDHVLVMDNLSTGSLKNIESFRDNPRFSFEEANILNWSGLSKATEWANRIYHFAAIIGVRKVLEDPVQVLETNILGCEILLKTMAQNKTQANIIIASSSSVYGYREKDLLNEDDYLGIGPAHHQPSGYAISKMADEGFGVSYSQKFGIPVIIIRLFNTIGDRQTGRYGMVIPRFIEQACTNQPITIYGDGTQTRSFCDVRDVIVAVNKLAENAPGHGDVFNVGNAHEITITRLYEKFPPPNPRGADRGAHVRSSNL